MMYEVMFIVDHLHVNACGQQGGGGQVDRANYQVEQDLLMIKIKIKTSWCQNYEKIINVILTKREGLTLS